MDEVGMRTRVHLEQLKLMIDFMSQHAEFASGTLRTLEARHESKKLWAEVAKVLNGYKGGTRKTAHGWSKSWSDFKIKLKNKIIELKKKKLGLLKKRVSPMTKLERRALAILGPGFKNKYVGSHQYDDPPFDPLPPEIKQEVYQETMTLTNGFFKEHSESDRLSGGESEHSAESDDDYEHNDQNADELSGIYPKWLVEVEKKRAEAELRRAKADEQRATTAAKNADAALIQAEALKKLSEAAERQANAIHRIALMLETRKSQDLMI